LKINKKNFNYFKVVLFGVNNKEVQGKEAEKSQWALNGSCTQVYSATRIRLSAV
jgi:hypothetical protein